MQIEFYLPLPPDGFWSGLMIYYMVGLVLGLYASLLDIAHGNTEQKVKALILFSLIWLPGVIMETIQTNRNRHQ